MPDDLSVKIIGLLSVHSLFFVYALLFVIMFVEGPTAIYVASFVSATGYLNIWIVFALGIFGGIVPDVLLFYFGRFLKKRLMNKITYFFGLNLEKTMWFEAQMSKHAIKITSFVKLMPFLPIPGIILCGFSRMNFKKFFITSLILDVIGASFFAILGFYSGIATTKVLEYFNLKQFLIPIFILLIIVVYFLTRYLFRHLSKIMNRWVGNDQKK